MFNFFKSNKKNINEYPNESLWSVLEGNNNGNYILVRKNDSAKAFAGHSDYPIRIGVAVPLVVPDSRGLPNSQESELLNKVEDILCLELEKDKHALQVLVVTTNGMREFIFYAKDVESSKLILEKVQFETKTHQVQFYLKRDIDWNLFMQFN